MGGSAKFRFVKRFIEIRRNNAKALSDLFEEELVFDENKARQDANEAWKQRESQNSNSEINLDLKNQDIEPVSLAEKKTVLTTYQSNKDNAIRTEDKSYVDSILRPVSGVVWQNLSQKQRDLIISYTGGSFVSVNNILAGTASKSDYAYVSMEEITEISNAIDKSELPSDMYFSRGIINKVADSMFGNNWNAETLKRMMDNKEIIHNEPFMSASTSTNIYTKNQDRIKLNIFAPKGTKALYVEPFSMHGKGSIFWDGKSKQNSFSEEFETIIQKGSQLVVTGYETNSEGKVISIDVDIIKQ